MLHLLDHFSRPWFLLLIPALLPVVFLLSRHSLAGLGPVRRWSSVILRSVVVLLLILALAQFRWLRENERLAVMFLVDRSASIPAAHEQAAVDFISRASRERDRERGDAVGLIAFGRTAGIELSPRPTNLPSPDRFSFQTSIQRDYTDLQSAIRLAMAAFPEGYSRRIVLLSDGNANRGDALEEAHAALAENVQIDTIALRYDHESEILLDKLVVAPEVNIGEPFEIRVVVESTGPAPARLRLFQNQELLHSEEVELEEGRNFYGITQVLQRSDMYTYRAVIEPLDAQLDAVPENNVAMAFTFISGQPRILLTSDDPALDRDLVAALRDESLQVEVVRPGLLPLDPAAYLQYDAILFSNVAAHDISDSQMELMENLVKGAGIGFVMLGGDRSFGAGGYLGSPIEKLLPVNMDVQQKKKLPNGALAIVMHSCEINNGNFWAKATIKQAIQILSPRDYAGVIYFDYQGGDRWLFPMMPCTRKQLMLNRLSNFAPGDMPSFQGILTQAFNGLVQTPAAIKHIIIFSDGDPTQPSAALVQQIVSNKITISTICMGFHSTPAPMQQLARAGGGNFYMLTGPDDLPEIFIREATTVRKALIEERTVVPLVRRGGSYLTGIDLDTLPTFGGYVITSEKEKADHFLSTDPSEDGEPSDPLLSSWHYGLGKSVAFTSDAGRRWTSSWVSWQQYRQFWSQTVRWVSRARSDDRFRISRTREGDTGIVFIDAVDSEHRFLNGLDFEATVITPSRETRGANVRQVGPGRYRAEFPVDDRGVYLASLKYSRDGEDRIYTTGVTIPYSPEYRKLSTNDALLARLASVTGGKVLDSEVQDGDAAAIYRSGFEVTRDSTDLWRTLLFLAALLFFVDVFVRRVVVDYLEVARTAGSQVVARLRRRKTRQSAPDERLRSLLKTKADLRQREEGAPTATAKARKFFGESLDAGSTEEGTPTPSLDSHFDASAAPAPAPAPEKKERKPASEAPSPPREEESYTSRLLAAKKRALEAKKKDDPPGKS